MAHSNQGDPTRNPCEDEEVLPGPGPGPDPDPGDPDPEPAVDPPSPPEEQPPPMPQPAEAQDAVRCHFTTEEKNASDVARLF